MGEGAEEDEECWSLATASRNATNLAVKDSFNPIGGLLTRWLEECVGEGVEEKEEC